MWILRIIDIVTNLCITMGGIIFYLILFSNVENGKKSIKRFNIRQIWLIKIGLLCMIIGGIINAADTSFNPLTVVLDVGLGLLFVWAPLYHLNRMNIISIKGFYSSNYQEK